MTFSSWAIFKRHNELVHGEPEILCCDFCSYSSKQKGNLKQHLKVKHPGDRYQCMYCGFKVNWKGTYIIHLKESHIEEMAAQGLGTTEESNPLLSFNGTIALSCNGEIATTL